MINLTQDQIDIIKKFEKHHDYCDTQENCWSCPLYGTSCGQVFTGIKEGIIKHEKPYSPTRLDYFVARIASGYMASADIIMTKSAIVKFAKELIAEIDKQEGAL